MRVLVACEESQAVCIEFRKLGHEAYSCDIQECSGGHPEWHIQDDAIKVAKSKVWELKIGFPPCTYSTNSGVRWLYNSDGTKNEERWYNMVKGAEFFKELLDLGCTNENPIPHKYALAIMGRKYDQIIQPWQFGHGETKATCLWLNGLPPLVPANIVNGREQRIWKMAPGENRQKERSKTFPGIAKAMAEQWSKIEHKPKTYYHQLQLL